MPALKPILEKLERAQTELMQAADAVPPHQWKTRPGEDRWSASEVVCHLISVERAVISRTDRIIQHAPEPVPLLKRFHLPMALVESRVIKRKTPIPLDAAIVREKEEMLAELRNVRERTLAFIEETKARDLTAYRIRHPFLGSLNTYGWFQMLASHEIRHTKQMREIGSDLQNVVARLQK
jgi:DinB superfamily